MVSKKYSVLMVPMNLIGHINATLALAEMLKNKGHRIVYACDASWRGKFSKLGFEEKIYHERAPPEDGKEEAPNEYWSTFVRNMTSNFVKNPTECLLGVAKEFEVILRQVAYYDPQLKVIVNEVNPDVVIQDSSMATPSLLLAGIPWINLISYNPLAIPVDLEKVPPSFSGLSAYDTSGWEEFLRIKTECFNSIGKEFASWLADFGLPKLPPNSYQYLSNFLNLYIYPEELDYTDLRPLGSKFFRLDSAIRPNNESFEIPQKITEYTW